MKKDGVTLGCATDFARRCLAIAQERRNIADVQDAMNNSHFKHAFHDLLDRLAQEYRQSLPLFKRPPWLRGRVGTLKTVEAMEKALGSVKCNLSGGVRDILQQFGANGHACVAEEDVEFLAATPKELGEQLGRDLSCGCNLGEVYRVANELGLVTCAPCDAVYICLMIMEQPLNDCFWVSANPPIACYHSEVCRSVVNMFIVERREDWRWLGCDDGRLESPVNRDHRFVFRRR